MIPNLCFGNSTNRVYLLRLRISARETSLNNSFTRVVHFLMLYANHLMTSSGQSIFSALHGGNDTRTAEPAVLSGYALTQLISRSQLRAQSAWRRSSRVSCNQRGTVNDCHASHRLEVGVPGPQVTRGSLALAMWSKYRGYGCGHQRRKIMH